jgi:hypothetical protein
MRVLIPVFVREFYLANPGFFLLVVAFAGGFMRSYDHIALAEFFISAPLVSTIPLAIWLLYTLKVMNFNHEKIKQNENEFIFCFILFPVLNQWGLAIRVVFIQLLPVFLYGLFLCLVASKYGMMPSLLMIVTGFMLLIVMSAYHLIWWLCHPNHEKKVMMLSRFLNLQFTKPFPFFFIEWISRHDLAMLLGTKIFSGLIVVGITALYKTETYDLRLLSIGILISSAANTGLILSLHRFENFHMSWWRGLPITLLKRMYFSLITIGIIFLPEVILLIRSFPQGWNWHDYLVSTFFLFSIPMLFYGMLFVKDRNQEEIMPVVFYCVIGWFVLILFKIPILLLGIVNAFTGLILWKRFHYSFEYVTRKNPPLKKSNRTISRRIQLCSQDWSRRPES